MGSGGGAAAIAVLLEGYYLPGPPVRACASIVLVQDVGLNIVVDPGSQPEPGCLTARLAAAGLGTDDIDAVFLTHTHLDHCRSVGLFPRARVLDAWGWWEGDTWRDFGGVLSANTQVIRTPGHSDDGLTLLVRTGRGAVAICGDVFFSRGRLDTPDPFAVNQAQLEESRRMVLARAAFVVPGHGPMFEIGQVGLR